MYSNTIMSLEECIKYGHAVRTNNNHMWQNLTKDELTSIVYTAYQKALKKFDSKRGPFKHIFRFHLMTYMFVEIKNKTNIVTVPKNCFYGWGVNKVEIEYINDEYFYFQENVSEDLIEYFKTNPFVNLDQLLQQLNENEQYVIKTYFGIDNYKIKNLRGIAKDLSLSHQRTSQIKTKSLEKLKHILTSKKGESNKMAKQQKTSINKLKQKKINILQVYETNKGQHLLKLQFENTIFLSTCPKYLNLDKCMFSPINPKIIKKHNLKLTPIEKDKISLIPYADNTYKIEIQGC